MKFSNNLEIEQAVLRWTKGLDEKSLSKECDKLYEHCKIVIELGGYYSTKMI